MQRAKCQIALKTVGGIYRFSATVKCTAVGDDIGGPKNIKIKYL